MADEKDREEKTPRFTTRVRSFREGAREHEADQPCAPKLPPAPGALPTGGTVDAEHVLNRKK